MEVLPKSLTELIEKLTILPGVGPKSAKRMAVYLLQKKKEQAKELALKMISCIDDISHCKNCRNFCQGDLCTICNNPQRNNRCICVVESLPDLLSIEQTGTFNGLYFVLMGCLSPIDRIGPSDLAIPKLMGNIHKNDVNEVILATNPTIEGEATAHYIISQISPSIKVTRLASGIPMGTELTYLNDNTLYQALTERKEVERN